MGKILKAKNTISFYLYIVLCKRVKTYMLYHVIFSGNMYLKIPMNFQLVMLKEMALGVFLIS